MKSRRVTYVWLWAGLALAVGQTVSANSERMALFRGYYAVNSLIQERMIVPTFKFDLGQYLGEYYSNSPYYSGLLTLLGTYNSGGLTGDFHNGEPNGVNMLLWHVLMGGFAKDISSFCGGPGLPGQISSATPEFQEALKPLCDWPAVSAQTDEVLSNYWLTIMSFDAPFDEYEAWRDFLRSTSFAPTTAQDAVQSMSLAIFLNPHFLLRK